MTSILDKIIEHKRQELLQNKKVCPEKVLFDKIEQDNYQSRRFMQTLQQRVKRQQNAVIAEIKKASPSLGVIKEDFNPVSIAKQYELAGAVCLSVLTDQHFFQGHDDYLKQVREAVNLPILRKDFTIDRYQILQARALGADAILLIAAVLNDDELLKFTQFAQQLGLDVLVEVHNEQEFARALKLPLQSIGVNNRNLHDFSHDLNTSITLNDQLPENYFLISESGITSAQDIEKLNNAGIYAFLVGGALMQADNPGEALNTLITGG